MYLKTICRGNHKDFIFICNISTFRLERRYIWNITAVVLTEEGVQLSSFSKSLIVRHSNATTITSTNNYTIKHKGSIGFTVSCHFISECRQSFSDFENVTNSMDDARGNIGREAAFLPVSTDAVSLYCLLTFLRRFSQLTL